MSSHPMVRRLTAAALLLMLASAPALAATADRPHTQRVPAVTGVSLLDQFLDWLGFPAAGPPLDVRGTREKSGTGLLPPLLPGLHDLLNLLQGEEDRGGMIDPNG